MDKKNKKYNVVIPKQKKYRKQTNHISIEFISAIGDKLGITSTEWEIKREHQQKLYIKFKTFSDHKTEPKNFGRILYANHQKILINLERNFDYEIRFREKKLEWSEWNKLPIRGTCRKLSGRQIMKYHLHHGKVTKQKYEDYNKKENDEE